MWIFTTSGFVSAVRNPNDRTIIVRSRDRASLEPISSRFQTPIKKTPLADYPYRIEVSPADFSEWTRSRVMEIDYSNFKSAVHTHRGSTFAKVLNSVWSSMHKVEDDHARG